MQKKKKEKEKKKKEGITLKPQFEGKLLEKLFPEKKKKKRILPQFIESMGSYLFSGRFLGFVAANWTVTRLLNMIAARRGTTVRALLQEIMRRRGL